MHRKGSTRRTGHLPGGQKAGRTIVASVINDYETQIELDEGLRRLWFNKVLLREEALQLIRFYCKHIDQYVADQGHYQELVRDINRLLFLAQTMEDKK